MAYVLPTFNLVANVWTFGTGPPNAPRVSLACNLAVGRRVGVLAIDDTLFWQGSGQMYLLVPPRSDIRGPGSATQQDLVEVPAGTGRFYEVSFVDDLGRGFTNEHRYALLVQQWPLATPWP